MKTDDDSFVRIDEVIASLDRINVTRGLLYGLINSDSQPHRSPDSKWFISPQVWPIQLLFLLCWISRWLIWFCKLNLPHMLCPNIDYSSIRSVVKNGITFIFWLVFLLFSFCFFCDLSLFNFFGFLVWGSLPPPLPLSLSLSLSRKRGVGVGGTESSWVGVGIAQLRSEVWIPNLLWKYMTMQFCHKSDAV